MGRVSRGLAACLLAVIVSVGAVACASAPETTPSGDDAPSQPAAPPDTSDSDPVAVVSLASVDVDGLHVTVAGFVTQVAEDDGACVFHLTSSISGAEVTKQTTGIANVETTSCGTIQIAVSELSRGPWDVALDYTSEELVTSSDPITVEVP